MKTLVIANKAYSSWSMRPWLLMRVFEIPFDEVVIPLDGPTTVEDIRQYNSAGKVPILVDDDLTVWDSLAIIEYIAETHPDDAIWPRDVSARTLARSLSAEMHSGFLALRRFLPMNMRRAPKSRVLDVTEAAAVAANVARIEAVWADTRGEFGDSGPFLFGTFSAADAMFAPVVNRLHAYAVPVTPETRAYMETVMALAAWRDWEAAAEAEVWHLARMDDI